MDGVRDPIDQALLDDWQRGFPITPQPFLHVAEALNISEAQAIERIRHQIDNARITRVGATCAPNTVSASTLAAITAPEDRIEEVASVIGAQPGVNHSYLREHDWNLWFVATGPDRAHVNAALERIERETGLQVLDLRLVRPFNVDLGFALRGKTARWVPGKQADISVLLPGDRAILQMLMKGLTLIPRPYRAIAMALAQSEEYILERIRVLSDAGIIARLGIIVRHRALGWRSNAMVVWDMAHEQITRLGPVLAAQPGVTLCYERTPVPGIWPYRLYSMIHARSRAEAMSTLTRICSLPEFADVPHVPLFSLHCFKQTGAMVKAPEKEPT